MEVGSPGAFTFVDLVSTAKKRNIEFCIIWQKVRHFNQNTELTGTPEGRNIVIKTSWKLSDDTLCRLNETDLNKIQYHVKTCYARYKIRWTLDREVNRKHEESAHTQRLFYATK